MKKKIIIKGEKVQEVGYRLFLLDVAEEFGLSGFQARNVKDYVEFIVEGADEKVSKFITFAKENYPTFAKVNEIIEEDYVGEVLSIDRFYHKFSIDQLVKIVDIGINMVGRQDEMLKKQDFMLIKQDNTINKLGEITNKLDETINKIDEVTNKIDETTMEIRNLRQDLKSFIDERLTKN
ncbi:MAG: acylphosphatase [Candidatus Methanomethylicia archaeon]